MSLALFFVLRVSTITTAGSRTRLLGLLVANPIMGNKSPRQPASTASEFQQNQHWVTKMKTAFFVLDADHDGFITLADIEGPLRQMIETFKVPPDEQDAILDQARRYWIDLVNGGTTPPADKVSESMFVENVARAVTTPPFEPKVRALGSTLLFLIDSKKLGYIIREDFLKIYSAHNVEEEHSTRLFESISGRGQGHVTKDGYVNAVLFFFTDLTDESDPRNLVFGTLRSDS